MLYRCNILVQDALLENRYRITPTGQMKPSWLPFADFQLFDDPHTQIATLGKPFESIEAAENPNSPKIVCDVNGYAMYFSRSVIPYVRGKERAEWLSHFPFMKHLGIYAYRREVLRQITNLPSSPLEVSESLEQLRWLENGYRIRVGLTDVETVGIDTPEDLQRAEHFLQQEMQG